MNPTIAKKPFRKIRKMGINMAAPEHAMPTAVQQRLWTEAADGHAYAVLDGAQNDSLLTLLHGSDVPAFECLLAEELEPDMAAVAPYLVELQPDSAFTQWLLKNCWGLNWGIFLTSREPLHAVWRQLRQLVRVYGPQGEPLYFRFYDPRVMNDFIPACSSHQLDAVFRGVNLYLGESQSGAKAKIWRLHDGGLSVAEI